MWHDPWESEKLCYLRDLKTVTVTVPLVLPRGTAVLFQKIDWDRCGDCPLEIFDFKHASAGILSVSKKFLSASSQSHSMITLISLRLFIVLTKTLTWTSLTVTPEWCDTAFKLGWNFNFFGLYNVCLDLMLLRRPEGDNLMWTGWNVIAMIDDSDVIVWDVVAMVDEFSRP